MSQILGYSSVFPNPRSSVTPNPRSSVTMGMFCVPDPRLLLGFPKSQILGYSKSQILGNYEHVLCPRSSVTGSCLRYGHVLCPRSPQIPDPRLPQIPDPRLLLGYPKSQILGNWELPKKWAGFVSHILGNWELPKIWACFVSQIPSNPRSSVTPNPRSSVTPWLPQIPDPR